MSTERYRLHPDLRLTALADEGVLLHLAERRYFSVNGTGLTILEALKEPRSRAELVDAVLGEYETTEETATEAVEEFLDRCLTATVVVTVQEGQ